ncbi:hypothetical protein [Paracoccus fontiphilus]|uniref:Uncharacterized protein n=1 Tax=Paracoccus fontiphilus TaxID=1815556 RepID=A0ABV7IIA3_9RHOB|nr:hypothetical protein [Paracoccus fontiphilus]
MTLHIRPEEIIVSPRRPARRIGWEEFALLAVFVAALIVAAPLLMEWAATWQPRPAACAGLDAEACMLLAQEGRF